MEVTGVTANLHLTVGPVEVHHRMMGEVAGVLQLLLEVMVELVSLIWPSMRSLVRVQDLPGK